MAALSGSMNSDGLTKKHGTGTTAAADKKHCFLPKLPKSGKLRAAKDKVNIQLRPSHMGISLTFAFHAVHP